MGTQLRPNVSARNAHRVLVPMPVCCLDGMVSYAILVVMVISDLLFMDGFSIDIQCRAAKPKTPPPSGEFSAVHLDSVQMDSVSEWTAHTATRRDGVFLAAMIEPIFVV